MAGVRSLRREHDVQHVHGHRRVAAKHVARCDAGLLLGDAPVLDAHARAAFGQRERRDIARRVHALRDAHRGIHGEAAILLALDARDELVRGPHAHADHHECRRQAAAVLQHHGRRAARALDPRRARVEMEAHAVRLVQRAERAADPFAELAHERHFLGRHHRDRHLLLAQAGGDLQPDEVAAEDDGGGRCP